MTLQEAERFFKLNNFYKISHEITYPIVLRRGIRASGLVGLLVGITPGA